MSRKQRHNIPQVFELSRTHFLKICREFHRYSQIRFQSIPYNGKTCFGCPEFLAVNHIILRGKRMATQKSNLSLDSLWIRLLIERSTESDVANTINPCISSFGSDKERLTKSNKKWQSVDAAIN